MKAIYIPRPPKTQITPWTRPNITGCTGYDQGTNCDVDEPLTWAAIDNIRPGNSGSDLQFDYIEDFRTQPVIRADSWIGAETSGDTIKADMIVKSGATLTIEPGTTLKLAAGVKIKVEPGGKIIANGTETNPISFLRADPASEWNKINLRSSSGNSFSWCLFDGGHKNVDILSKNNTFAHCTFRGGWRGLSSGANQDGSGNSSATITHSLVQGNSTVGIVAYHAHLDIGYSTIKQNDEAGMWVSSATVASFYHNLVTDNGAPTNRDGIEVQPTGTLYMRKALYDYGYNEVFDNGFDQIYSSGDLLVGAPPYLSASYNSVHGTYAGTPSLVDNNNSNSTVDALYTWWGQSSTDPAMFRGSVDASNPLSSDPTVSEPHGAGGAVPQSIEPGAEDLMVIGTSESSGRPSPAELWQQVRKQLADAQTPRAVRTGLQRLYQVTGLAGTPQLTRQFNALAQSAADGEATPYAAAAQNKAYHDRAALLGIFSHMRDGAYKAAYHQHHALNPDNLAGYDRRDFFYAGAELAHAVGNDTQARQQLQQYYAAEQALGTDMHAVKARASILAGMLQADQPPAPHQQKATPATTASSGQWVISAYPNPFNPTTTFTVTVPEQATVRLGIYNLLGRRVATLHRGPLQAGTHRFEFDGTGLASGLYLYHLQAGATLKTGSITLMK